MAKHLSQSLKIQVSKLVRDSEPTTALLTEDLVITIEAVIKELVGEDVLVEVSVNE